MIAQWYTLHVADVGTVDFRLLVNAIEQFAHVIARTHEHFLSTKSIKWYGCTD